MVISTEYIVVRDKGDTKPGVRLQVQWAFWITAYHCLQLENYTTINAKIQCWSFCNTGITDLLRSIFSVKKYIHVVHHKTITKTIYFVG